MNPEQLLHDAYKAERAGDVEVARSLLRKILANFLNTEEAETARSILCRLLRDHPMGEDDAQTCARLLTEARKAKSSGDFSVALEFYKKLALYPDIPEASVVNEEHIDVVAARFGLQRVDKGGEQRGSLHQQDVGDYVYQACEVEVDASLIIEDLKDQYRSMTVEDLYRLRSEAVLSREASVTLDAVINDKCGIRGPVVIFSRGPVTVTARTLYVGGTTIPIRDINGPLLGEKADPPWFYQLVAFLLAALCGLLAGAAQNSSGWGFGGAIIAFAILQALGRAVFGKVQLVIPTKSMPQGLRLLKTSDTELVIGLGRAIEKARLFANARA